MGNKNSGRRDHRPRGGGRPPSSYISKNGVQAVKVSTNTRSKLEVLSARLGAEAHEMVERLIDERLAEFV